MKLFSKVLGVAAIAVATLFVNSASAGIFVENSALSSYILTPDDTLNAAKKLRVVFIPNSSYKQFKIGIESTEKTDVNVQVMNEKGMVVYSNLLERITKKLEEVDFSFLKRGEYTVKVSNGEDEYSKKLQVP